MRILTADDVRRVLTMAQTLEAVAEAAAIHTQGRADTPARHQLATVTPEGEMLVMPSVVNQSVFGLKLWHRFEGPFGTLPRSSASILLLDPSRGEEVLLDGEVITDLRTGAMTGVAARYLVRTGSSDLAVIGAGIQARTQILAVLEAVPSITRIQVFSRNRERLEAFVRAMQNELSRPDVAVVPGSSAQQATEGADVVIAATTSSTPVIEDGWIKPGALVCGVGSHDPQSTELEPATVARAECVVVDTLRGGVDGAKDVAGPIDAGLISRADVVELGDLVTGAARGRTSEDGVTVFKSVGFATSDVVVASLVAQRASEQGAGIEVDLHSSGPAASAPPADNR